MERKRIKTKKETSIIKKKESKTEVLDSGHIRKTKSEILTEYVIIESQLVVDDVNARRYTVERENFPELIKKKVTEREELSRTNRPEEDFNTSDLGDVSDGNESSINRTEPVDIVSDRPGENLNQLKCNEYDLSLENDRDRTNIIINKESRHYRKIPSNLKASNSCTTVQSTSFSQYENEPITKENNRTLNESNNTSADHENTAKYVNPKIPKDSCPQSDLNEKDMSKMNSLITNLRMNLSQNDDSIAESISDTKDDVNIVKMCKKDADKENDIYNKWDTYLISTGCKEKKKKENEVREGLEHSVSYLVNFFEDIKNRTSGNTNITEGILISKEKQNGKLGTDVITKIHKCLSSDSRKSSQFKTDVIINENVGDSKSKLKMSACSSGDKDLKTVNKITQVKSPNIVKTKVSRNISSMPDAFCVPKYKRPETSNENLKQDAPLESYSFLTSDDNVKDKPKNISNTSEISFISPQYACKKIIPYFCRPALPRVELQMPQQNDGMRAACCSTNGNRAEKRTIHKDVDNMNPGEVDKSIVFLTPNTVNGLVKINTSSKMEEHKLRANKKIVSYTKVTENDCGYYSIDWTNWDRISFAFALIFTMLLAYYTYSYNA